MEIKKDDLIKFLYTVGAFASVYGLLGFECGRKNHTSCAYYYPFELQILVAIGASMIVLGILLSKRQ